MEIDVQCNRARTSCVYTEYARSKRALGRRTKEKCAATAGSVPTARVSNARAGIRPADSEFRRHIRWPCVPETDRRGSRIRSGLSAVVVVVAFFSFVSLAHLLAVIIIARVTIPRRLNGTRKNREK